MSGLRWSLCMGIGLLGVLVLGAAVGAAGETDRWVRPSAARPEPESLEYHVTAACNSLRYGPRRSFQLAPPKWPDLPVTRHEKFDPASVFRLLAAATTLFTEEPRPATATAPTGRKR